MRSGPAAFSIMQVMRTLTALIGIFAAVTVGSCWLPFLRITAGALAINQNALQRWWYLPGALAIVLLAQAVIRLCWPARIPAVMLTVTASLTTLVAVAVLAHTLTTTSICDSGICQELPPHANAHSGPGIWLLVAASSTALVCAALTGRMGQLVEPADYDEQSEEGQRP